MATEAPARPESHTAQRAVVRPGDRIFSLASLGAGILIVVILAGVALFLLAQSTDVIKASFEDPTQITGGKGFFAYVWPLILGTLVSAAIALLVATPFALGIALFTTHMAPRRLAPVLGYVIDLLAAIPSVVYGLWGLALAGHLTPAYQWLSSVLGWTGIFAPGADGVVSQTGRTILTASLVLSIMVLPIITSLVREVFLQTPRLQEEAALAMGATRWEMIRMAVLPHGKSGITSAVMLGLGRALGETMAVAMILSSGGLTLSLLVGGNQTIASEIAQNFPEAAGLRLSELISIGLVLFVITLLVNMGARAIVAKTSVKGS
ncbi:phosphate ABC transporter permease subunit PstC [Brevibacterium sp. 5221]|uniref:Phosphate transport system permease protein n=1 Tax=Brevibacterium rongguiense TaxID=2695267 RepID=A0A6N9H629_9MICO|nr:MULTISPECIES: phosphate ABC transporter permease subunit PstC [Brevibacterium]MYM19530.1 phosphate ABC transporter permease subunit PstC [Brevibacterium rongguiense]WAL39966.1 phosphate ABC transporter permease subunit PstC [Brevibacterium sp. BRM-1]